MAALVVSVSPRGQWHRTGGRRVLRGGGVSRGGNEREAVEGGNLVEEERRKERKKERKKGSGRPSFCHHNVQ